MGVRGERERVSEECAKFAAQLQSPTSHQSCDPNMPCGWMDGCRACTPSPPSCRRQLAADIKERVPTSPSARIACSGSMKQHNGRAPVKVTGVVADCHASLLLSLLLLLLFSLLVAVYYCFQPISQFFFQKLWREDMNKAENTKGLKKNKTKTQTTLHACYFSSIMCIYIYLCMCVIKYVCACNGRFVSASRAFSYIILLTATHHHSSSKQTTVQTQVHTFATFPPGS